ncbi:FTR1 family protein [Flavobacteriaceae bacterium]|nr:FTR1 family protein [Flavobacteriaceae bacterium]
MLTLAIIIFREIIEISLILSLILFSIRDKRNIKKLIAYALTLGFVGSAFVALIIDKISNLFQGIGQEVFNAFILFTTALLMLMVLIYSTSHAKELKSKIEQKQHSFYSLVFILGFTIMREGSEIVLLTYSHILTNENISNTIFGFTFGVLSGIAFSFLFYFGLKKLPINKIFPIINWLLIFIIVGLIMNGVLFLMASGLIEFSPSIVWDLSNILSNESVFGSLMGNIFGYYSKPTSGYLITYILSLCSIIFIYKFTLNKN